MKDYNDLTDLGIKPLTGAIKKDPSIRLWEFLSGFHGMRTWVFEGENRVKIPRKMATELVREANIQPDDNILVLLDPEFAVAVRDVTKDVSRVTFYSDHEMKTEFATQLKVKSVITSLDGLDMKFDVIIGNPPYSSESTGESFGGGSIHHKFLERMVDMKPRTIAFITPTGIFNGSSKFKKTRDKLSKYGMTMIRFLDCRQDWKNEIAIDTCAYVLTQGYRGDIDVRKLNETFTQPQNGLFVVGCRNAVGARIVQKVSTPTKVEFTSPKLATPAEDTEMFFGFSKKGPKIVRRTGNIDIGTIGSYQVVLGYMRSGSIHIIERDVPVGFGSSRFKSFSDRTSAEKFKSFLESKLVRYIVRDTYVGRSASNSQFSSLPDLDMSQFSEMNDEVLAKHFQFTPDELAEIDTVGNFYPY